MATFNRCHLLERSLQCYAKQDFPKDQFELIVIDDHSTDDTQGLVHDFCHEEDIRYTILTTGPKKEAWRDCGAVLNAGIRASTGEHIILTHPEVIPGRKSVAECVSKLQEFEMFHRSGYPVFEWPKWGFPMPSPDRVGINIPWTGVYACCKPYYLSPRDQERIDTVDWEGKGPLAIRDIEGFYDDQPGHPDYQPRAIESVGTGGPHTHWLSWVFGGCSRRTWREIGGMAETHKWGSVDVLWVQRRHQFGIINHTCTDADTLVIHQNHSGPNDTPTPRIEQDWRSELEGLPVHDRAAMTVDHLGWRS